LFFGGKHISYLIQTQQGDFRIIVNEGVDIPGFGQFGRKVKESDKYGLMASEDGLMAKRGGDVAFAHSGRTYENQVGGFLEEVGVKKLHDFVSGDFRVEGPVEIAEEFDPADSRHFQQIGDSFFLSGFVFLREESFKESSFLFGETFQVLEKSKMFPKFR
jgi:hypothetical protein